MNRRWFALVLMMALIPGCSGNTIETAPSEALYDTKPRSTVGFVPFYDLLETDGTIQAAVLETRDSKGFRFRGEDILIFHGDGYTTLTVLDGHTLAVKAETTLAMTISADDPSVTVSSDAVTYADVASHELVFLNSMLKESGRIPLPEKSGQPILSSDQQFLYYCTANAVRVLDLNFGTDRPVREMDYPYQQITALHCDDSVLQCRVASADGNICSLYISAKDGRLLYESVEDHPLWTDGDLYFALNIDGAYQEHLSGSTEFGPSVLVTETEPDALTPVLAQKLVLLHTQAADGRTVLDGYHLETGSHIAQTRLPENYEIVDIRSDPQADILWLLCHNRDTGMDILCCWDLPSSDPHDAKNYLQPRWNRDHPDWEGLAQCEALAAQLSQKHGVQIRLPTDTSEFVFGDHRFLPEYQVPLLHQMLLDLDSALSRYPEGFLQELAVPTGSGCLNICPVRSIYEDRSPDTSLSNLLYRDSQRDVWLMVSSGPEFVQQVDRMLCELIDCRVLGVSDAYDSWDRRSVTGSAHLERVQILEASMQENQAGYFSSGFMQSNLRQLCLGIRETFRTCASVEQLPWEKHLTYNP